MAQTISREMGAPIRLARTAQASAGLGHLKAFVRALEEMELEHRIALEPVRVGPPAEDDDHIGTVVSEAQFEKIQGPILKGIAEGARRVARRPRSGMVQINGAQRIPGLPFGGMKQSGRGREGGRWGIEDFLEVTAVSGWPA